MNGDMKGRNMNDDKFVNEFLNDYRKFSNEHGLGTSETCQYNTYPEDPCKEVATVFPKIAGFITPMCSQHYKEYKKLVGRLEALK